jgi:hypothetical protein
MWVRSRMGRSAPSVAPVVLVAYLAMYPARARSVISPCSSSTCWRADGVTSRRSSWAPQLSASGAPSGRAAVRVAARAAAMIPARRASRSSPGGGGGPAACSDSPYLFKAPPDGGARPATPAPPTRSLYLRPGRGRRDSATRPRPPPQQRTSQEEPGQALPMPRAVSGSGWAVWLMRTGAADLPYAGGANGNQDRGERAVLTPCPDSAVPEGSTVTAHRSTRESVC